MRKISQGVDANGNPVFEPHRPWSPERRARARLAYRLRVLAEVVEAVADAVGDMSDAEVRAALGRAHTPFAQEIIAKQLRRHGRKRKTPANRAGAEGCV